MKINIDVLNEYKKTVEMYEETIEIVRDSVCKLNSMTEAMLDWVRQENAPLEDEVHWIFEPFYRIDKFNVDTDRWIRTRIILNLVYSGYS